MIQQLPSPAPGQLGFKLTGKLHDADYKTFVPLVDAAVAAHGKVRMLAQFEDFHGWDLHAMWDDTKFAATHCAKVEKIALVGDKKWEEWMTKICRPFTMAKLQYFDVKDLAAAWKWLAESD